jgi:hypothetical protein
MRKCGVGEGGDILRARPLALTALPARASSGLVMGISRQAGMIGPRAGWRARPGCGAEWALGSTLFLRLGRGNDYRPDLQANWSPPTLSIHP